MMKAKERLEHLKRCESEYKELQKILQSAIDDILELSNLGRSPCSVECACSGNCRHPTAKKILDNNFDRYLAAAYKRLDDE